MKELPRKSKIALKFLENQATARQVADHLGVHIDSVYEHLRLLQRLGFIEKVGSLKNENSFGRVSIFKATGATELVVDDCVQIAANNPFNLKPEACHA